MGERTIQAAIRMVHNEIPRFISRESDMYRNEEGAAKNLRWIVGTLIDCFDNKKKPPRALLYSLRGLSHVADLTEKAASLDIDMPDENTYTQHKKLRKEAEDSLLDCFGLLSCQGAPGTDHQELVSKMAELLCPSVNEEYESIGGAVCNSVTAAAKRLSKESGISYKTYTRAWKDYENIFD